MKGDRQYRQDGTGTFGNSWSITHIEIGISRDPECSIISGGFCALFVFDHVLALPHVEGETYEKLALTRMTIPIERQALSMSPTRMAYSKGEQI
jgi:hypothetical protein